MRVPTIVSLVAVILASSAPSFGGNAEQADALFKKGTKLFADGKVDEACEALEESERLDHNGSTLYNLGICREEQGKSASAYAAFTTALEMAKAQKKVAREKSCMEHLASLEPKLSKITVVVPSGVAVDGFEITLDGKRLDPSEWGAARAVDPGQHAVEAKAPGKKPFNASVSVAKVADRVTITVTPLADDASTAVAPKEVPITPAPTTTTSTTSDVAPAGGSSQRTLGYVVGAAGLVVAGVGGYFLVHSESLRSDADGARDAGDVPGANDLLADARKNRTLGFVGVGVGIAAIGTGVVLLLTAPSSSSTTTTTASVQVAPTLGPNVGGLSLMGRF